MKNDLKSLNDYLFEELERLNDDETLENKENLDKELARSKAITQISNQIVQNAKVVLTAKIHSNQFGDKVDDFYKIESKPKQIKTTAYNDFEKETFKEEVRRRLK